VGLVSQFVCLSVCLSVYNEPIEIVKTDHTFFSLSLQTNPSIPASMHCRDVLVIYILTAPLQRPVSNAFDITMNYKPSHPGLFLELEANHR
jgi:hypothetical protein